MFWTLSWPQLPPLGLFCSPCLGTVGQGPGWQVSAPRAVCYPPDEPITCDSCWWTQTTLSYAVLSPKNSQKGPLQPSPLSVFQVKAQVTGAWRTGWCCFRRWPAHTGVESQVLFLQLVVLRKSQRKKDGYIKTRGGDMESKTEGSSFKTVLLFQSLINQVWDFSVVFVL